MSSLRELTLPEERSPRSTELPPLRFVTATSLFDGHDASINIFRRLLQSAGVEVIHLGHNRSVEEIALCAIQEDAQGIALSSYQGGHMEFFRYLRKRLDTLGGAEIHIFGGGGGVIVPEEIAQLEAEGITKIFSPQDGVEMGLQGMIDFMVKKCLPAASTVNQDSANFPAPEDFFSIGRALSRIENTPSSPPFERKKGVPILGITGPGGAGKSSLTDEVVLRFLCNDSEIKIAIIAIDPTRAKTGGALLGDRIRMNTLALYPQRIFMRSLATRRSKLSVADSVTPIAHYLSHCGFDLVIIETTGTGQSDIEIAQLADRTLYVMTAEYGAPTQLEKIGMLDYAHVVALNKSEKQGAQDALHYVQKQWQRNHDLFDRPLQEMPVYRTCAHRVNDSGVNALGNALMEQLQPFTEHQFIASTEFIEDSDLTVIPTSRERYLSEIAESIRSYHQRALEQSEYAADLQALKRTLDLLAQAPSASSKTTNETQESIEKAIKIARAALDPQLLAFLEEWPQLREQHAQEEMHYKVRDREFHHPLSETTLSGTRLPIIALPAWTSWRELTLYYFRENRPGSFPYTAGVFPFRRQGEMPTRMFAGEGGPERTNRRFHYLSQHQSEEKVARLSTAYDSVTLYGANPENRPDIYGKIGNAGVSVPTLDDSKRLYSGFDLLAPTTSVSMTINGPAPILLAYFFNTAIDQQIEKWLAQNGKLDAARQAIANLYRSKNLPAPTYQGELPPGHDGSGLALLGMSGDQLGENIVPGEVYQQISRDVLQKVRGTVQADILKEDQAQNTCIFSTPFSLRLMADIQAFFIEKQIRNFYSVSISGYHIAEAGANPITQAAFTLANGFTYAEYYLAQGMKIDDFAPNFSYFFSNGIDAEYAVIGRVARRIWAIAMKNLYRANERSQKLKYHVQTSGRSLHAQEMDFNDIRTTLQALYALYDNCNSLHTNAADEAITTPTEQSVRRAMAIQLIINRELGLNKNHNPIQGAYIIEELTALVEEAILTEFDRLTDRGGVIGAMELMYQRSKIQEESLEYEQRKHSGELPIIGINTFLREQVQDDSNTSPELRRSSEEEKKEQIERIAILRQVFGDIAERKLAELRTAAQQGTNLFVPLMEVAKYAPLGDIAQSLYRVGGSYRRNS